jgi:hypothetical protein
LILNELIDVFPSKYFIKLYFHHTVPDNLGPSKIPLTLLKTNRSEEVGKLPERWCKFYPTHGSFIGFRSANTVNLVITDLKPCYKPRVEANDSKNKCNVLNFVGGSIHDGRGKESFCTVNGDRMYTLVLAENGEQDNIFSIVERFCSNIHNDLFPYYILVFYNSLKSSNKMVCNVGFSKKDVHVLHCDETNYTFEMLISGSTRKPYLWVTSLSTGTLSKFRIGRKLLKFSYFEQDVDKLLMREIMTRDNGTASTPEYLHQHLMWATIDVSSNMTRYSVLVEEKTTGFLSCFSEPKLTFSMYVSPFLKEVWIAIGACCSVITILTSVYNQELKLSQSFSPLCFFVSTLVEEPYSVPSSLWNNRFFKTLTLTWLLTAVIFTNLYVGLMISDVTTPLRGELLRDFDQVLQTEKVYSEMSGLRKKEITDYWRNTLPQKKHKKDSKYSLLLYGCETPFNPKTHEFQHKQLNNNKESFTILKIPLEKCGGHDIGNRERRKFLAHPWMYSGFQYLESELYTSNRLHVHESYKRRLYAFFSPRNRHYPKKSNFDAPAYGKLPPYSTVAVEEELVNCERSVLMGDRKDLSYELSYLMVNYPKKGFYMSKDTFEIGWSTPKVWSFKNSGMSRVPLYFQLLIEAGIHNVIFGLRKNKHYLMRRMGSKYVKEGLAGIQEFGMEGSIQTIFIILIVSLLIGSLVFTNEVLYEHWRTQRLSNMGMLSLQLRRN